MPIIPPHAYLSRKTVPIAVRGYRFFSHYPPGYQAYAVNIFCRPPYGCEPARAEVRIRKFSDGWVVDVYPPSNMISDRKQVPDFKKWEQFKMRDELPYGLSDLRFNDAEAAMSFITERLNDYGFKPW